jgi:phosphate transport system substrate-binding protein
MPTPVRFMRHIAVLLVALFALLAFISCGSGSKSNSQPQPAQVLGAGSSFIYPAMTRWIDDFQRNHPGMQINYQSIGSGGGIQQLKQGLLDFAASDAALNDGQLKQMPAVVQIPESAGPVCITYNLPDLKTPLRLTPETLAAIYLGNIKNWQDPAIKKDNPGVKFPNQELIPAHRSDGSGTTNIFTTYLATISPEWEKKVGKGIALNWPLGLGGKGNEGVTGIVKQTTGGIGYVELIYANQNNLPVALIRNKAGNWIKPSAPGTTAAMDAFAKELAADIRTPIVDPPASAKDAYPIAGLTFLIIPTQPKSPEKARFVADFVQYIVTQGQDVAATLDYAKLSPALQQNDQDQIARLKSQPSSSAANTLAGARLIRNLP